MLDIVNKVIRLTINRLIIRSFLLIGKLRKGVFITSVNLNLAGINSLELNISERGLPGQGKSCEREFRVKMFRAKH